MSKKQYRKDKTCLNCRFVVENKFCSNCGQENTDTRKTFHHLFIHFFEDLTHYENAFWRTIKNLLFKPASLTKEYLSGKRLSYLAPVRLYIFISFVTFFLLAVFPDNDKTNDFLKNKETESRAKSKDTTRIGNKNLVDKAEKEEQIKLSKEELEIEKLKKQGVLSKIYADSIQKYIKDAKKKKDDDNFLNLGYSSMREVDSIRKVSPDSINDIEYWISKKTIPLNEKYTNEEIKEKFMESARRNFPKALFIYLPIFAFILWLFHNKKRWYYFDHGIFTLHYFSFLLLVTLILFLLDRFLNLFGDNAIINFINTAIEAIGKIWMFYYFFPAHHRFYGETRIMSFIKSSIMLFINMFAIILVLCFFVIYTFINLH